MNSHDFDTQDAALHRIEVIADLTARLVDKSYDCTGIALIDLIDEAQDMAYDHWEMTGEFSKPSRLFVRVAEMLNLKKA